MLEYADRYKESQIKIQLALGLISEAKAKELQTSIKSNKEIRDKQAEHNEAILKLAKETGVNLLNLDANLNATKNQAGGLSKIEENAINKRFNLEKLKLDKEFAREESGLLKSQNAEKLAMATEHLAEVRKDTAALVKKNNEDIAKLNQERADKQAEDDAKAREDLKSLYEAINQLDKQYQATKLDADGKELQALYDKYDKIRLQAKGNVDALMQIEKLYHKELDDLILKQSIADAKYDADKLKSKQDIEDKIYLATLSANDKQIVEEANKWDALIMEAENAGLDATLLRQKQADAINAIVKKQAEDEVKVNKDKNKKLMTDDEKRAWVKKELEDNAFNYMKQAGETIISFMKNVNERSLDDVKTKGDEEVALLDAQLANKEISQEIYNERKIQIEKKVKEEENKIKLQQFKLDKQQAIINIAISTAESISKTIANVGLPIGLPLVAIAAAFGLAQIALVESQPTPKFEKGGEVGGKLHRQGGTLIEAERGEYIINRKHSKENKSLLEAINTGNGSKYIEDNFIAPMLKEQQKKFNQMKDSVFSDNLVNSMILNSSNFKDSNLLDSMKRSRQADKENALLIINSLKSNYNSRKW
jgi:hypothetical protein